MNLQQLIASSANSYTIHEHDIDTIFRKKNLNLAFLRNPPQLDANSPLEAHVALLFENIYSKPYPGSCFLIEAINEPSLDLFKIYKKVFEKIHVAIVVHNEALYYANAWDHSIVTIPLNFDDHDALDSLFDLIIEGCETSGDNVAHHPVSLPVNAYLLKDEAYPIINRLTSITHRPGTNKALGFKKRIARYVHGITHTASAAYLIPILHHFYLRYGLMNPIDSAELFTIQIAALMHDCAREDEGRDEWDYESALIVYIYLRRILSVSPSRAKVIAEAMANKDFSNGCGLLSVEPQMIESRGFCILNFNYIQGKVDDETALALIRAKMGLRDAIVVSGNKLFHVDYNNPTLRSIKISINNFHNFRYRFLQNKKFYQTVSAENFSYIEKISGRPKRFKSLEPLLNHRSALIQAGDNLFFADFHSKELIALDSLEPTLLSRLHALFKPEWSLACGDDLAIIAEAFVEYERATPYFSIDEHDGLITVSCDRTIRSSSFCKTAAAQLIHDADCLEVIRARSHFEGNYLDLWQSFIQLSPCKRELAKTELAHLIYEVRSLITLRGDHFIYGEIDKKTRFESARVLDELSQEITAEHYPLLFKLSTVPDISHDPLIPDAEHGFSHRNLPNSLIKADYLFARGISQPNRFNDKGETRSALEFRKTLRRPDDQNPLMVKCGNDKRSASLLGFGGTVFSNAGGLVSEMKIYRISDHDIDSGFGQKKDYNVEFLSDADNLLHELREKMKLGGNSASWDHQTKIATHTEVIGHIQNFSGFYFTNDPNFTHNNADKALYFAPLLQALYLRDEYHEQMKRILFHYKNRQNGMNLFKQQFGFDANLESLKLPLIKLSALHNRIEVIGEEELTDEKIVNYWIELTRYYMNKRLSNIFNFDILLDSISTQLTLVLDYVGPIPGCYLLQVSSLPLPHQGAVFVHQIGDRNTLVCCHNELYYYDFRQNNFYWLTEEIPLEKQVEIKQLIQRCTSLGAEATAKECHLINQLITFNKEDPHTAKVKPIVYFQSLDHFYSSELKSKIQHERVQLIQSLITKREDEIIQRYRDNPQKFKMMPVFEWLYCSKRIAHSLRNLVEEQVILAIQGASTTNKMMALCTMIGFIPVSPDCIRSFNRRLFSILNSNMPSDIDQLKVLVYHCTLVDNRLITDDFKVRFAKIFFSLLAKKPFNFSAKSISTCTWILEDKYLARYTISPECFIALFAAMSTDDQSLPYLQQVSRLSICVQPDAITDEHRQSLTQLWTKLWQTLNKEHGYLMLHFGVLILGMPLYKNFSTCFTFTHVNHDNSLYSKQNTPSIYRLFSRKSSPVPLDQKRVVCKLLKSAALLFESQISNYKPLEHLEFRGKGTHLCLEKRYYLPLDQLISWLRTANLDATNNFIETKKRFINALQQIISVLPEEDKSRYNRSLNLVQEMIRRDDKTIYDISNACSIS